MVRKLMLGVAGVAVAGGGALLLRPADGQVNTVKEVSPGVYFHEGDLHGHGHCNNGWVVFDDYVLVVDANFPSGAKVVIPKIKAATSKPIRFAFDTHHHGDHAYGNQVWVEEGAIPVASAGVIDEMKKYETGYYGGKPGRWEEAAQGREDVRSSKLKPPTLLFPKEMVFDDGKRRLELHYLGVAHTHGDGWGWMPKEKILFSGDACVNGPFNYAGDGNIHEWVKTLERAQKFGAKTVVPGHGPTGDGSLLEDQKQFFLAVIAEAKKLRSSRKSPAKARAAVDAVKASLAKRPRIGKFVGDFFPAQLEKAWTELGGMPFPPKTMARNLRERHALDHQAQLLPLGPKEPRAARYVRGR
jgi:glyoxylase-like metal-dependent hydrolase (beta-lactamase superfamily II)